MLGPIFAREWITVPRRARHYVERAVSLGIMWVLGLTAWQATIGWEKQNPTLGDTARFGLLLFQILTLVQLTLILFFSAISASLAVAREKDRRTFVLLLLTDLRNHEIVLGKFLGSTLQILLLLAGTIPILAVLVLLGGIEPPQVVQAVLVLLATGLAAGSLGCLIALWREKTFQTLAMTVLTIVLYLCFARGLSVLPSLLGLFGLGGVDTAAWIDQAQRWLDPFEAMVSVLNPPLSGELNFPAAYGFTLVMLLLSTLLNLLGIARLRVWNPSGEPIMQREGKEAEEEDRNRAQAHAAPGEAREVWANPILWREVRTRAYGRRMFLVKLAYAIVLGLLCYYALAPLASTAGRPAFFAANGLVPVAVLSLLLISAQAVTAVTTERDVGALDLLLVTDLTPQEFIFGKIWGIAWNTKEFWLPPLILAGVYAWLGLLGTPPRNHPELLARKNFESLLAVELGWVVLVAFTGVLGIHVALRNLSSPIAILQTLGTIFFLSVGTLVCIFLILINGRFESQWASFIFFLAAGIGGLWWVFNGDRPSPALGWASLGAPLAMFYTVTNILVARPGSEESTDPLMPFSIVALAFGFAICAMLVPLLSEFDVALGRTTGPEE